MLRWRPSPVRGHAFSKHERPPCLLDAVPTVVPVHRVVAPTTVATLAAPLTASSASSSRTNSSPELGGVSRPSRKAWTQCPGRPAPDGQANQRAQVRDVAVHAAVRDETHQVHGTIIGHRRVDLLGEHGVVVDRPVLDRQVDAREFLIDHTTGADVEVTHLGVAHLARRQAHGEPTRVECGVRELGHERVEVGCRCRRDRRCSDPAARCRSRP